MKYRKQEDLLAGNYPFVIHFLSFNKKLVKLASVLDLFVNNVDRDLFKMFFEKFHFDFTFQKAKRYDELVSEIKREFNWSTQEYMRNRNIIYLVLKRYENKS